VVSNYDAGVDVCSYCLPCLRCMMRFVLLLVYGIAASSRQEKKREIGFTFASATGPFSYGVLPFIIWDGVNNNRDDSRRRIGSSYHEKEQMCSWKRAQ